MVESLGKAGAGTGEGAGGMFLNRGVGLRSRAGVKGSKNSGVGVVTLWYFLGQGDLGPSTSCVQN